MAGTEMQPWMMTAAIQVVATIFAAGILWAKVDAVGKRLDRVERWINATRNPHGEQLER